MESLLPRLPDRPLIDTIPEIIPAAGQEKSKVGFFLGCAMNLIFADISRDTIHCLSQSGYTVVIPKGQQCCGTPNIAEGERKIYREMAEHNVALFEEHDVQAIVSDCAACGMELKSYRETLAPVTRASRRAEMFSKKVKDISEFLVSALGPATDFGPLSEKMCFHDPCHLRHGQNLVSPQRDLLRRIPGLFLVDIPDEGQCCGSAGIYNITHRERSMKILEAKVAAIDKTGADRVITCPRRRANSAFSPWAGVRGQADGVVLADRRGRP
jgi:glycolate oxidase iron-sulfur subunit